MIVCYVECQSSMDISNTLCTLFADSILKNITTFHWITRHKDKTSELGDKNWIRLCDAIRTVPCPHLVSLCIPNNNIGEKGCKEFVRLCFDNKCSGIKELDLSGNRIGNNGVVDLFRALQIVNLSPQMEYLNIENNGIGSRGIRLTYNYLKLCDFHNLVTLRIGRMSEELMSHRQCNRKEID